MMGALNEVGSLKVAPLYHSLLFSDRAKVTIQNSQIATFVKLVRIVNQEVFQKSTSGD